MVHKFLLTVVLLNAILINTFHSGYSYSDASLSEKYHSIECRGTQDRVTFFCLHSCPLNAKQPPRQKSV